MKTPLYILLFALILSCSEQETVSEQELKDYVMNSENGLRKQSHNNGVDMEVIYRPTALVIAQQLDGVTDVQERKKIKESFDTLSYFVLKLSRKGQEIENAYVSDETKFVRVISYLSSAIGGNIYLITEEDTLRAVDAVYARMFGTSSATSVMAVFDKEIKKLDGTLKLYLDDTELGLGQNEFEFDLNDINKAPTINLD